MLRPFLAATWAATALLGSSAAHAGTHWSIGISLPPVGVVVADPPAYAVREPARVYYAPAPVYVVPPAPRYVERVVYDVPPPRVVYDTGYRERCPGERWDRRWERRHAHGHDRRWDDHAWDGDRDDGPRRGR